MKKVVVVAALMLAGLCHAETQEVDIKGIHLGMSQDEYNAIPSIARADQKMISLAGWAATVTNAEFYEGKLDNIALEIGSMRFSEIRDALKAKYPDMQCKASTVTTRAGVNYEQETCSLPHFNIVRYGSDITYGAIYMSTDRWVEEKRKQREARSKDI